MFMHTGRHCQTTCPAKLLLKSPAQATFCTAFAICSIYPAGKLGTELCNPKTKVTVDQSIDFGALPQ